MNAVIFAYSRRGCETARRVSGLLQAGASTRYCTARLREDGFYPISKPLYGECFSQADALIFIGACGIAVREIAPYVSDKRKDPAVLCIDELGQYVIPLLSGHIGGANRLARKLARGLGATAVITTATDINHRFSADTWASENGYAISSMEAAKRISAAILEGDIPLASDFPISSPLPSGLIAGDTGPLGISITYRRTEPFAKTLRLVPKVLNLGIGCRKGIPAEAIHRAVDSVFQEKGIDPKAAAGVYSIDLKEHEPGLMEFCRDTGLSFTVYSAEQLQRAEGNFTASEFVSSVTGVDNVCERAAMMEAERLIIHKTAISGVTVAVALRHWEVQFG